MMTNRDRPFTTNRRGVALFAALWLVVAIGVVALEFSLEARQRRLAAANTVELAEARAAAMGGIEHAHARLDRALRQPPLQGATAALRAADPWVDADTLLRLDEDVDSLPYRVTARDVNSFLNINRANENQILLFLTRLGYDYGLADDLAQSIMDWRDTDIMRRARGAEREAYLEEGRLVLPRDGSFQEIDELLHVMHMTPEIYDSIAPFLTLRGDGRINVNTAPEAVLRSIGGMTDAAIMTIMRTRDTGRRFQNLAAVTAATGALGSTVTTRSINFETTNLVVTSIGWNRGHRTPHRIEALLTRTTGSNATSTVSQRRSR